MFVPLFRSWSVIRSDGPPAMGAKNHPIIFGCAVFNLEVIPALRGPGLAVLGPLTPIRRPKRSAARLGDGSIEPVNNADGNIVFDPVFGRLYLVLTDS